MFARSILFSVILLPGFVTVASADVFVGNPEGPSVTVYASAAVGDAPPVRTIAGPNTGFNWPIGVTTDLTHNEVYVADFFGETIRVFDLAASGNAAPIRTLVNGPNSHLAQPRKVALDLVHDEIYVACINHAIRVYPRTASGDAPPLRTIEGPQTRIWNPITIVLDLAHNEIIVDSYNAGGVGVPGILVFARTASGDAPPLRAIAGQFTRFGEFTNMVDLDLARDEIYAQGNDGRGVVVFPRTASGNVPPIRDLIGPSTGIEYISGMFVDEPNDRLILAGGLSDELLVFDQTATGDTPPLMDISGPSTGLAYPWGLAVDGRGGFTGNTVGVAEVAGSRRPGLALRTNPGACAMPTAIDLSLLRAGHATVAVFAPDGRRVATILDRELAEGRHSLTWDHATDPAPAGVYFVRLSQGHDRVVRKLVLR